MTRLQENAAPGEGGQDAQQGGAGVPAWAASEQPLDVTEAHDLYSASFVGMLSEAQRKLIRRGAAYIAGAAVLRATAENTLEAEAYVEGYEEGCRDGERSAALRAAVHADAQQGGGEAVRLLGEVQWASLLVFNRETGERVWGCPVCGNSTLQGHAEWCRLAAALRPVPLDAQQGEREEAARWFASRADLHEHQLAGQEKAGWGEGETARYIRESIRRNRLAASALLRSVHQGEPDGVLDLIREVTGWGGIHDDFASGRDAIQQMASYIRMLEEERAVRPKGADGCGTFGYCHPENGLVDAAGRPISPAPPAAPHGKAAPAPDLMTFRRAAEEDRCPYCGLVDPWLDDDGHCNDCGGWIPPSESLHAAALHWERERALEGALATLYELHATGVFTLPDEHYSAITAAAAALASPPAPTGTSAEVDRCDEECTRCSGEHCDRHGYQPCDCDVIDRHAPTGTSSTDAGSTSTRGSADAD